MNILIELFGWVGTFLVLTAYFLLSTKKVESGAKSYQLMNLVGATGIGINVFSKGSMPALFLQIIWGAIAILSLLKNKKNKG